MYVAAEWIVICSGCAGGKKREKALQTKEMVEWQEKQIKGEAQQKCFEEKALYNSTI